MFEGLAVADLDAPGCADALADSVLEQRRLDARRVRMVGHWADLHPVVDETDVDPRWTRLRRRTQTKAESYGADGTPPVSEFAATELGMLLQTTTSTAGTLLRDVLDLRHRHPLLYDAVLSGTVELWQARQVVLATARADLSLEQARSVDAPTVAALTGLPFGRSMTVVEGKIIAADPDKYEERRAEEAQRRYVSVGRRPNEFGLGTLVAQSTAGDIARLYATISHLADAMLAAGDIDADPVRHAKALALLANPAMACVFLAEARAKHDQRLAASRNFHADGDQVIVTGHRPNGRHAGRRLRGSRPDAGVARADAPLRGLPLGTLLSLRADADHTIPYVPPDDGGPPGQTRLDNLGPLGRGHHRAKTFGAFTLHQPRPGMYLWRTPTGLWFQVDGRGTHPLGRQVPEILRQRGRQVARETITCAEAVAQVEVVWDPAA
jgi:hypothetical protein